MGAVTSAESGGGWSTATKWLLGISGTLFTLAMAGLVNALMSLAEAQADQGRLMERVVAQLEAIEKRLTATEGRMWSDVRDINERLRYIERRTGGGAP